MLFPVGLRNGEQNALESRTSVVVFWRKIRSTVKRLAFGGEKGRQRPAALPANGGDRCLIAAVYIGALIAINFYCDEVLIDDLRNLGVLVRFPVHYVAPVAPHRADIEQHRLVLLLGRGQRRLSPLMPADRLVHGRA